MRSLLACGAIALVLVGFAFRGTAERRALDGLPDQTRGGLYQRVLDDVDHYCRPPPEALGGWCQAQASFLSRFPECDARCDALTRPLRPSATR